MRINIKKWRGRLFLVLVAPMVALLVLEGVLLLVGQGAPRSFLLKEAKGYRDNPWFGLLCFEPSLLRQASHFQVAVPKPDGVYRIVLLGGSAVMGDPEPTYGLHRVVESILSARYPEHTFEVINTGMPAINSHVVRRIATSLKPLDADAVVVYMGNNEVVGPYGPAAIQPAWSLATHAPSLHLAARATRTGQLLDRWVRPWKNNESSSRRWRGLEMFVDRPLSFEDPALERVVAQFEKNAKAILRDGHAQDAQVVLCSVATALRSPPFGSMHRSDLTEASLQAWSQAFKEGVDRVRSDDFEGAILAFNEALKIDDQFADLHYQLARCYHGTGQNQLEQEHLVRARDLDPLRFRADSRINQVLRRIGKEADVFVDAERKMVAEPSEKPLFYDHVHFTHHGHVRLALLIADALAPDFKEAPLKDRTEDEVAVDIGFTPWDALRVWHEVYGRFSRPPFTQQFGHQPRVEGLATMLRERAKGLTPDVLADCEAVYLSALQQRPSNHNLRLRYAEFLHHRHRYSESIQQALLVLKEMPDHTRAHHVLAQTKATVGKVKEALAHFQQAYLPLVTAEADAALELGTLLAEQGKHQQALELFEQAAKIQPHDPILYYNMALSCSQLGRNEEALSHYATSLKYDPQQPEALNNQGVILGRLDRPEEAQAAFRSALEIDSTYERARQNLEQAPSVE